eukprot:TRINITY_DN5901_c0_g1_i2.p1 TRINITY_DN5901_c0_g1~~TRINITY_DN5901_c0_g1_i2.p1  ORF type:complete len:233 (-),score=48.07 TRINITY_DN5901_c0_g1_i2:66-764(-)
MNTTNDTDTNGSASRKRKLYHLEHTTQCARLVAELKKVSDQLLQAKLNKDKAAVASLSTAGALLLIQLRACNRDASDLIEELKIEANIEKERLEKRTLQLQQLLYQRNYFRKEIKRCTELQPKAEIEDLVPVADFIGRAPTDLQLPEPGPTADKEQHHEFMVHRLQFELLERKRLRKDLELKNEEKKKKEEEHASRVKVLKSIQDNLAGLAQVSRALPFTLSPLSVFLICVL